MEIEILRELLNKMIESGTSTYNEVLEVSQKLDTLIVDHYRAAYAERHVADPMHFVDSVGEN